MKHLAVKLFSFLYLSILIALILGQFQRVQLTPTIAVYLHDLIILITLFCWLTFLIATKRFFSTPLFWTWPLGFAGTAFFSLIVNYPIFIQDSWIGGLYLIRWLLYTGLYLMTYDLIKNRLIGYHMKKMLLIVSLCTIVLGLLQYVFLPDTRFLYTLGWDDHLNRLIGTMLDPGFTGILFIMGFILSIDMTHLKIPKTHSTLPSFFIQAMHLIGIFLTYSRAAYLTFSVIIIINSIYTRKIFPTLQQFLLASLFLLLLPRSVGAGVKLDRVYSIESRLQSSQSALEIFFQHPFWGIGFNNYRQILNQKPNPAIPSHTSGPDNSFIHVLLTTGLIGFIVYTLGLVRVWVWSSFHSRSLCLTLTALTIHSFTNHTLFYPFVLIWMWLLLAQEVAQSRHRSTL